MSSLSEDGGSMDCSIDGLTPKKVWFKDKDEDSNKDMVVDQPAEPTISWKDKLFGNSPKYTINKSVVDNDFDLMDGNVKKSVVNSIPSIDFSERINHLLIKDMETTVIFKLLDRNIGFSILLTKYIISGNLRCRSD